MYRRVQNGMFVLYRRMFVLYRRMFRSLHILRRGV